MHELVKIRTLSVAFACIVTQRATTSGFLPFCTHTQSTRKIYLTITPQNTQTPTNKHENKNKNSHI